MQAPEAQAQHALNRVGENLFRSDASEIYYAIFRRDGKQIRRSLVTRLDVERWAASPG